MVRRHQGGTHHPDNPLLPFCLWFLVCVFGGWRLSVRVVAPAVGFSLLGRPAGAGRAGWGGARRAPTAHTAARPPRCPGRRPFSGTAGTGGQRRPGGLLGECWARAGRRRSSPRGELVELSFGQLRPSALCCWRSRVLVGLLVAVAPPVAWGAVVCRDVGGWALSPVCGGGATGGRDGVLGVAVGPGVVAVRSVRSAPPVSSRSAVGASRAPAASRNAALQRGVQREVQHAAPWGPCCGPELGL